MTKKTTLTHVNLWKFAPLKTQIFWALRFLVQATGIPSLFSFPDVEIKKGEIVIVHLRSAGRGCISELDDNLNLSSATYSVDGIRDIWSGNKDGSRFNDNADIILIRNPATGVIIDALPYAKSTYETWQQTVEPTKKKHLPICCGNQTLWYLLR